MIHALCCNRGPLLGFGQNECPLQDALRVQRETRSGPRWMNLVLLNGCSDVGLECRRVIADALVAGFPNRRRRLVGLLQHGAHQAREFGQFAVQQRFAEIDVSEDPLQRIGGFVIGSGGKEAAGLLVPARSGRQSQIFFAAEVMEKAAFGEPSRGTNVIDAGRGVPTGADQMDSGVQQLAARIGLGAGWHYSINIPTSWYVCQARKTPQTGALP